MVPLVKSKTSIQTSLFENWIFRWNQLKIAFHLCFCNQQFSNFPLIFSYESLILYNQINDLGNLLLVCKIVVFCKVKLLCKDFLNYKSFFVHSSTMDDAIFEIMKVSALENFLNNAFNCSRTILSTNWSPVPGIVSFTQLTQLCNLNFKVLV